jgi:hypothetical protein
MKSIYMQNILLENNIRPCKGQANLLASFSMQYPPQRVQTMLCLQQAQLFSHSRNTGKQVQIVLENSNAQK